MAASLFAALFLCLALYLSGGVTELGDETRELAERREVSEEAVNVLAIGADARPDGGSEGMGVRADTVMLARILPESGEVRLLSIPRDLFVEISPGYEDRLNAAYANGGAGQTVRAVQGYTGIELDGHAVVGFEGFEEVVDAMGGVEVEVGEDMPEIGVRAGRQTLDGEKALLYARYRGTSGGDLDRMERQREILASLRHKALNPDSVTRLPELSRVAGENVETDLDFDVSVAFGRTLLERGSSPLRTGQLVGKPATLSDGRQVLIPDDETNRRIVEEFLR